MLLCTIENCQKQHYALGMCQMHWARVRKYGDPHAGQTHAPPEVRFWRFVTKTESCWLYRRYGRENYGRFSRGPKGSASVLAHRFSYEMHHGPIPVGMFVMHTCDEPLCVNPDHLKAGTPLENSADMMRKGRHAHDAPRGQANGQAKLNPDLVRLIRSSPMYHAELARSLGISVGAVRSVRSGRTWSHVT